jgi:hypothetical protein
VDRKANRNNVLSQFSPDGETGAFEMTGALQNLVAGAAHSSSQSSTLKFNGRMSAHPNSNHSARAAFIPFCFDSAHNLINVS